MKIKYTITEERGSFPVFHIDIEIEGINKISMPTELLAERINELQAMIITFLNQDKKYQDGLKTKQ
nr:MAG TPA: hypothetical protein [Caudoviricetes sp.]